MHKKSMLLTLALLFALVVPAFAQSGESVDPNANINWPPPVYVVRGEFEVRGTANLPSMTNYFLDFRPLGDDLEPVSDSENDWFPAVLASSAAVNDSVLGLWNTELVADGLYELRLTVNVQGGTPVQHTVSPLRIENTPSPFAATPTPLPTATQAVPPTLAATAVPTQDAVPRVTITTPNGNVREGDSQVYRIIASFPQGTQAQIRGLSNRGSGWYYVQLADGRLGWMSPEIVQTSGDLTGLPLVAPPPPPPPTQPPLPTAPPFVPTVAPSSNANLVAGIVVLDPAQPTCGQTFTVGFDVANLGSEATTVSSTVNLVDQRAADGSQQGNTIGGFPVLQPGQTFRVNMPLTISTWYNETHRITLVIDPSNQVPENNEGDNTRTVEYTLQKGDCP